MAAKHYVLTLTGAVQSLVTVLPSYVSTEPLNEQSWGFASLQADAANTHVVYVGGSGTVVSSSNYGFRIEAPASSIPPAPSIIEPGQVGVRLSEISVLGTNGEKLTIFLKD